ncbi:MAG: BatD family protein [Sulfurimonas sp.]|nr:BatD family protein [Sulfurimonas sp.]
MNNIIKLFLLLLIPHIINAKVIATVDYKNVELGDMVTYSLEISGDNISRPNIQRLCGADVISTSSQTSVNIINGNIRKRYILSYKFIPQKSCKIDPIEIDINNKAELSNAIDIVVKPVTEAKNKDFQLILKSSKEELYVGETFKVTLLFKQKIDAQALDSEFLPPKFKGFWIKKESKPKRINNTNFVVTEIVYTLAPQRVGKLNIQKAHMRIASRTARTNSWGDWSPTVKWKTYFSNELNINIKPLPSGVDLVGDFSIKVNVDKKEVDTNEAINITVEVSGMGNLEDVKSFKPYIDGVSVFDEKLNIEDTKLTQKIALISEKDFSIPPFTLKYFDSKTKEIKTISTKKIDIKVKNSKPKEKLIVKRQDSKKIIQKNSEMIELDKITLVITFIVGLIIGILLMLFKPFRKNKKQKNISIKDPKILLMKLLPYRDDDEVKKILDILENNIYTNKKEDYDKKALKEVLKRYKIE